MGNAVIAGVGMVKFAKPGVQEPYRVMAAESIRLAMKDAGVDARDIKQALASFIFEGSGAGQHAIYDVFQTGIPIINLNNACAAGSSAIFLARQLVEGDVADCVLVVGFDEMPRGAIPQDLPTEMVGMRVEQSLDRDGYPESIGGATLRWFGSAGKLYLDTYGAKPDIFAKVAVKSRSHAARNPYAVFTSPLTEDEVMNSTEIFGGYMTKLMACPPTCGAAAVVVMSEKMARQRGVASPIEIIGQALESDTQQSWTNAMDACGAANTARAAAKVYEQAGIGPDEVDVIELHDCFTTNEVMSYEALGLCGAGEATGFIADGNNSYGGKYVVNPSGGLMSKGHPVGATGIAQCCELVWHLRGQAGGRQVENARIGLQHNVGIVSAAAVTMYRLASHG